MSTVLRQRKVDRAPTADGTPRARATSKEDKDAEKFDRIWFHAQSLFWVGLAAASFYFGDLHHAYMSPRVITLFWWLGHFGALVFSCTIVFLVYGTSLLHGRNVESKEWDTLYPKAIPVATVAVCTAVVSAVVAIWPIYNILSVCIVAAVFMGVVTVLSYVT